MTEQTDLVVLNIKRPDEAMFKSSEATLEMARLLKVTTPDQAITAADDLKAVKRLAKQVNEKRLAITRPINEGLKEVNAFFKPVQDLLADAEQLLKAKILQFQTDQDRIARELQAKADATARKEREKLLKRAAKAEAKGKSESAQVLREVAEAQTAPMIESAAPKLEGVARRVTWTAEVIDPLALAEHIVKERHDLLLVIFRIDQSSLNRLAREFKDELNLPGVEVQQETSIAARAH